MDGYVGVGDDDYGRLWTRMAGCQAYYLLAVALQELKKQKKVPGYHDGAVDCHDEK